jgi:flagellar protein FlaG
MDNKVAAFAATPDPTFGQKPAPLRSAPAASAAVPAGGPDPADMRLVIEEDTASGSYIYKTINRVTGELIQQLPRDQVLKLRDQADYVAGEIVRAKA